VLLLLREELRLNLVHVHLVLHKQLLLLLIDLHLLERE